MKLKSNSNDKQQTIWMVPDFVAIMTILIVGEITIIITVIAIIDYI